MKVPRIHVRVEVVALLECCSCGTLWCFVYPLEDADALLEERCQRCRSSMFLHEGTVLPIAIADTATDHPPASERRIDP